MEYKTLKKELRFLTVLAEVAEKQRVTFKKDKLDLRHVSEFMAGLNAEIREIPMLPLGDDLDKLSVDRSKVSK